MVRRVRPAPSPQAHVPLRMCLGCRRRAPVGELLRFVVARRGEALVAVPDPSRRMPGRGASLHRDPACVALAERRRAWARAFRVSGVVDIRPLCEYVAQLGSTDGADPVSASGREAGRTGMSPR